MKNIFKISLSLLLFGFLFSCQQTTSEKESANSITVDTDFIIQSNYYGGAVQWEPNDVDSMDDARLERLFKRVDFMKLGYIRCIIRPYTYCLGFKDNVPQYIWDENAILVSANSDVDRGRVMGLPKNKKFSDTEWHRLAQRQWNDLLQILTFCEEKGIDVMFGDWWNPNDKNFYFLTPEDPVYARIIADCVDHLVNVKKFTCIKQYNMGNEVNINPPAYTWEKWSTGIKNLYAEFKVKGLQDKIVIVGPDGGYWQNLWFNLTIDELKEEVGVLDYHWYIDKDWLLTNRVEDEMRTMRFFAALNAPGKPMVFGEVGVRDGHNTHTDQHNGIGTFEYGVGMADILIQSMRAGWSAATAWDMDDAMHYHETGDVKVWGFWNSVGEKQGKPEDEQIRPWYYVWSLLSRNFPKGSDILYSNSFRDNGLNCVAVRTPNGDISFAIVNNTDFEQNITLKIPNIVNKPSVNKYVYFENDRPVDNDSFPVVKEQIKEVDFSKGLSISFPGQGFVLISTEGADKPEITSNESTLYDPLDGLQRIYAHSPNLGMNGFAKFYDVCLDGQQPAFNFSRFKHDHSTIHPSTNEESAYIVYKFPGMKNFKVAVSGNKTTDDRFKIYGSSDNKEWKEIKTVNPKPQLTIWDWYHTTLSAENDLSGIDYLKIEMNPLGWFDSSRIREVSIEK